MTEETPGRRLARFVKQRREELGLRQDQLGDRGGPSTTTLTKVEKGDSGVPHRLTLQKLDIGLGWRPGSSYNILKGGVAQLDTLEDRQKSRQFQETLAALVEIDEARRRQPDDGSIHAERHIRAASRLLDAAIQSLSQRARQQAIDDLDTSVVVIRNTIVEIERMKEEEQSDAVEVTQEPSASAEDEGEKSELERRRKERDATSEDQAPRVDPEETAEQAARDLGKPSQGRQSRGAQDTEGEAPDADGPEGGA